MLLTIWSTSLVLALLSLAVMAGLVVVRLVSERRLRRHLQRRDALLAALLAWLSGAAPEADTEAALAANRDLAADLLIEIFEIVRGDDRERLAALAERAGVPAHLRGLLASRNPARRLHAAESLAWFPSPEGTRVLMRALDDRDQNVSLAAAASLADLGQPLPVVRLLGVRIDQDGAVSRRLEAVLTRIAGRQGDDLVRLARDEGVAPRVRAAAVDALAQTGVLDRVDTMAGLAGAASPELRAAVARGLGVLAHPAGADAIARLLGDPDWDVRAEAAEAVGRIGLVDLSDRLCALLGDEVWWVRFRSAEALAALGAGGIATLRRLAEGHDVPGRTASLVLAERGLA